MYENTNSKGNQSWIKTNIFTCFWYWCWQILFFLYKVKIPYEQFLIFLSFMNKFSEAADRRCSSKIVLLKISWYSELKRDSSTGVFLWILRSFYRTLPMIASAFFKTAILQMDEPQEIFKGMSLLWRPNFFSSQDISLNTYI